MKKIIDIPSIKKQLQSLKIDNKKLSDKAIKIKKQYKEVLMLPDEFNLRFSKYCWIANDFFAPEIMKESLKIINETKNIKNVDNYLASLFNESSINNFITSILLFENFHLENLGKGETKNKPLIETLFIKYFIDRKYIINIAQETYFNENYISCIPLLLSIIDGITNDIDTQFGFFNDKVNMIIEDTIVAHESGLQTIKNLVTKSRKQTTNDEIFIPYRNGILHGRDLNYGNKIVAAKCWHILFCLYEWAQKNNLKYFNKENKNPILKDEIDKYVDKDLNIAIKSLFEYFINNKYNILIYFDETPTNKVSKYSRIEDLSKLYKEINILDFKLLDLEPLNERQNIYTCTLYIKFEAENMLKEKSIEIIFNYSDIDNNLVSIKNQKGHWKTDLCILHDKLLYNQLSWL